MRRQKRRRPLHVPVRKLIPNLVTLGGLCCGLSSIRFAIDGEFRIAVALLAAAAIIDGMDGRIARLLNSTSNFGAQLDSLSDFLCFGVAPAFVLYIWKLHEVKDIGWAVVLFFTVCCALRLARFNANLSDEKEPWETKFFTGIPSPAGAMLSLMPIVGSFYMPPTAFQNSWFCIFWVSLMGLMMASRIPTFAAKRIRIPHDWLLPIMLMLTITMVFVFIEPWVMFNICGLIYCFFVPISLYRYNALARYYKQQASLSPDEASSQG